MRVHPRPSAEPGCIDLLCTGVPVERVPEITAFMGQEIRIRPIGNSNRNGATARPMPVMNGQPNVVPRMGDRYLPYPGEFHDDLVAEEPAAVAVA